MKKIINFYKFIEIPEVDLPGMRSRLRNTMLRRRIKGTVLLATEGINGSVCGSPSDLDDFVQDAERVLSTPITCKESFAEAIPFRRTEVKIKREVVTLRRAVDVRRGEGTHVKPSEWNALIKDPDVFVLDARNDYEFRTGTFERAVNPRTTKFSELPDFVSHNLDPRVHKKVAMFCTGGIRCEKFAPYLKERGFEEVYQLEGGILSYLAEVPKEDQMWRGECFVFDTRVSLDGELREGSSPDLSQENE